MSAPDAATQAAKLHAAAAAITEAGEFKSVLEAPDGRPLGIIGPALARPLAAILDTAAYRITTAGTHIGQSVRNPLEIAGLVLHEDLLGDGSTG